MKARLEPVVGTRQKGVPNSKMTKEFTALLSTPEPPELGPGPRAGVEPEAVLNSKLEKLLKGSDLGEDKQQLIRALVLLWHDHLDPAHVLAQNSATADGALVHGIMHRREPDYGNAAYWFRRAGKHPVFRGLADAVGKFLHKGAEQALMAELIHGEEWDPFAFIKACEQSAGVPRDRPRVKVLRDVQRIEFGSLLDWLAEAPRWPAA